MRIVPANIKPPFCSARVQDDSHAQDSHLVRWAGSTNTCTPSENSLTLLCHVMFRCKITYCHSKANTD